MFTLITISCCGMLPFRAEVVAVKRRQRSEERAKWPARHRQIPPEL